jgi:four helix bundle protein
MNYDTWEESVTQRIKGDPVWQFLGYRKAMFLYDLTWEDCQTLRSDPCGRAVVDQLIRSAGSICANVEEGTGRGFQGKEYSYFLRLALGSARESKGWYWRARRLLPHAVTEHRLKLLDEIISLLLNQIK